MDKLAQAIVDSFTSPNEYDSNLETANIVDGLYRLARAIDKVAVEMKAAREANK